MPGEDQSRSICLKCSVTPDEDETSVDQLKLQLDARWKRNIGRLVYFAAGRQVKEKRLSLNLNCSVTRAKDETSVNLFKMQNDAM
jgi:hypothetical protein